MKGTFTCKFQGCFKTYVCKAILTRHIQAFHSDQNKFQCKVCGKSMASKQNLNEHSYIHSGIKPYACQEPGCGMTFRQGTHFSAHKKTHRQLVEIPVKAFLQELVGLKLDSEELENNQSIFLPKFCKIRVKTSLPNLFDSN